MRDVVAGIDVSATRGLDAAVMLRDGGLIETAWLPGVEALRPWLEVWAERLMVVAVDAPSGLAQQEGGRQAERELRARRTSLYLTATAVEKAPAWMHQGWRVYELLAEMGFPEVRESSSSRACAIECYPYAAYLALSQAHRPSAEKPAAWARRLLEAAGYTLAGTGKDAADAVAAALTARAYVHREAVAYGDAGEGVIWVPRALPDQASHSRPHATARGARRTEPNRAGSPARDGRPPCECGCGMTPAGRRSRFLPGHDAILLAQRRREATTREADETPG